MRYSFFPSALLLLASASTVLADFSSYTLQVNTTKAKCGPLPFGCGSDSVCSYDDKLQRYYCCELGTDGLCQTFQNEGNCEGSNNTATDDQTYCDRLGSQWCCLKDFEKCTVRGDNINLCWSNAENPFAQFDLETFSEIYASLESENPSASTISLDASSLFQALSGTSTLSSSVSSASPTASSPPAESDSSGISGGAIGGIVVGVVAGLAIVIGAVWFFLRKRKAKDTPNEPPPYPRNDAHPQVYYKTQEQQQPHRAELETQQMPVELDARQGEHYQAK